MRDTVSAAARTFVFVLRGVYLLPRAGITGPISRCSNSRSGSLGLTLANSVENSIEHEREVPILGERKLFEALELVPMTPSTARHSETDLRATRNGQQFCDVDCDVATPVTTTDYLVLPRATVYTGRPTTH